MTPNRSGRGTRRWYVALALVVLAAAGALYLVRDPLPHFMERRSSLLSAVESPLERADGYDVQTVKLRAASGLVVDLAIKRPAGDDSRRRPLVLILGGHRTGRDAVHLIGETRGAVVAALSYPYRGDHRPKGLRAVLRQVPLVRAGIHDTPPAIMVALDYLLARPDVDPARVEGVGVSLGAPFICIAGALDERLTRVWAVHGSGGIYAPLELNMRRKVAPRPVSIGLAALGNIIIGGPQLAPERWVGRIAPRPFVMINAEEDDRIPRPSVEQLYASAGAPKEMVWMPGGHVRSRPDVVRQLVDVVLARMLPDETLASAAP